MDTLNPKAAVSFTCPYVWHSHRTFRGTQVLGGWHCWFRDTWVINHALTWGGGGLLTSLQKQGILGQAELLGTWCFFPKYFKPIAVLMWLKVIPETSFSEKTYSLLWILTKSSWQVSLTVYLRRVCDSQLLVVRAFQQFWVGNLRKRLFKFLVILYFNKI